MNNPFPSEREIKLMDKYLSFLIQSIPAKAIFNRYGEYYNIESFKEHDFIIALLIKYGEDLSIFRDSSIFSRNLITDEYRSKSFLDNEGGFEKYFEEKIPDKIKLTDRQIIIETIFHLKKTKKYLNLEYFQPFIFLKENEYNRVKRKLEKSGLVKNHPNRTHTHIELKPDGMDVKDEDFDKEGNYTMKRKSKMERGTKIGIVVSIIFGLLMAYFAWEKNQLAKEQINSLNQIEECKSELQNIKSQLNTQMESYKTFADSIHSRSIEKDSL